MDKRAGSNTKLRHQWNTKFEKDVRSNLDAIVFTFEFLIHGWTFLIDFYCK